MSWCGDESMTSFGSGPSVCFCQSVITTVFNLIFIAIFIYRYLVIASLHIFDFLDYRTLVILRFLQIGSIVEGILIMVSTLVGGLTSSAYFYVTFQLIAWLMVAILITLEVWRLTKYPGVVVLTFLGGNLVCNILTISMGSGSSSTGATALAAIVVLLNTALLLVGLFKDSFRSEDDMAQEELKKYSVDFQSSNPVKYDRNTSGQASNRTWVFTKLAGDEEEDAHDMAELEAQRAAASSSWSVWDLCFSARSRRHSRAKEMADARDMTEPLVINSPGGSSSAGSDPYTGQHATSRFNYHHHNSPKKPSAFSPKNSGSPNPIVQSALERNLGGGAASDSRHNSRTVSGVGGIFTRMFSNTGRDSSGTATAFNNDDDDRERFVSCNSNSGHSSNNLLAASLSQTDLQAANKNTDRDSFMTDKSSLESIRLSSSDTSQSLDYSFGSTNSAPGMSRALLKAMDSHKAKIAATNPILDPRGGENNPAGGGGSNVRAKKAKNAGAASDGASGFDHASASAGGYRTATISDCMVTVQRWSTRRRHDEGGADSPTPTKQQQEAAEEYQEGDALPVDSEPKRAESGGGVGGSGATEVEYEIAVRVGNNANQAAFSDQLDWNSASNKTNRGPAPLFWTVWKSTGEIHALHGVAHSALGDSAPRRPRLKSTLKAAADLSNAELLADMRSVAVFLNALLRSQQSTKLPALAQFLEFDSHIKSVAPAIATPASFDEGGSAGASPFSMMSPDSPKGGYSGNHGDPSASFTAQFPTMAASGGSRDIASGAGGTSVSLMAAAEENAASQVHGQQDKWRKLFFQMRVKIKPHDVGIRCRLFEGVFSGQEVTTWLVNSAAASAADGTQQYQHARDLQEACSIAQELLSCGLLVSVCSGFDEDDHHHRDGEELEESAPSGEDAAAQSELAMTRAAVAHTQFSINNGYIYRFPNKSSTANVAANVVFGANVIIKIQGYTLADDEEVKPSRDTTGFFIFNNGLITSAKADSDLVGGDLTPEKPLVAQGGGAGHVKYHVEVQHGGDSWPIFKRYREFETLNRNLIKEGVRPDVPLPTKALTSKFVRGAKADAQLEQRKVGLEQYLSAVVISTVNSGSSKAVTTLAMFLDDSFNSLRVNTTGQTTPFNS